MIHAGTVDLLEKHNMASFNVQALGVERTLCEKIMSLVRFSQVEDRNLILSGKVRHIYDLHLMLKDEEILSFLMNMPILIKTRVSIKLLSRLSLWNMKVSPYYQDLRQNV